MDSRTPGRGDAPGHPPPRYGVRSYLHQFYDDCTGGRGATAWDGAAHGGGGRRSSHAGKGSSGSRAAGWHVTLWKLCLLTGVLVTMTGAALLVAGRVVPARIEEFGKDDFFVVDSRAVAFNRVLDTCRVAGAALFCLGGAVAAACCLGWLLARCGGARGRRGPRHDYRYRGHRGGDDDDGADDDDCDATDDDDDCDDDGDDAQAAAAAATADECQRFGKKMKKRRADGGGDDGADGGGGDDGRQDAVVKKEPARGVTLHPSSATARSAPPSTSASLSAPGHVMVPCSLARLLNVQPAS
uniref:Uncharacterized protein LOC116941747 n=1 Tax=Petromyzon marinus TaxID=7757 RepID=A0AAJ7T2J4_PETMA|nr:uncharacterized protein LOC116941747 [Petromyzon marinus]